MTGRRKDKRMVTKNSLAKWCWKTGFYLPASLMVLRMQRGFILVIFSHLFSSFVFVVVGFRDAFFLQHDLWIFRVCVRPLTLPFVRLVVQLGIFHYFLLRFS